MREPPRGWHTSGWPEQPVDVRERVGHKPEQGFLEYARQNPRAIAIGASPITFVGFAFLNPWIALLVILATHVAVIALVVLDAAALRRRGYTAMTAWWIWEGVIFYLVHRGRQTGTPPHAIFTWVVAVVIVVVSLVFFMDWHWHEGDAAALASVVGALARPPA